MALLSYTEAAEQIQHAIQLASQSLRKEPGLAAFEQARLDSAAGRVLAEPILADRDQPPFPRATRDGFAARAVDASSHHFLALTGQIRAGQSVAGAIPPGEAWEIMTGAAVPSGADAVFMIEHAEFAGGDPSSVRMVPPRTLQSGENIVPRGAEARAGELLISAGVRLTPTHIALAAQCGYARLAVFHRPRVAILATGDELVAVEETPGPNQIRNSNSPMLAALVSQAGGDPVVLSSADDHAEALDNALAQAANADLLLISGGISAGRFDLVDEALSRAGTTFHFRGVAMQPGKPIAFGQIAGLGKPARPVFALPGNPISSAVTFRLFAASLLAALGGEIDPNPRFALARLAEDWTGKPGLTRFLPAHCDFGAHVTGSTTVNLIPWQGSGDLAAYARANCCLVIPAEAEVISAGSPVQILLT